MIGFIGSDHGFMVEFWPVFGSEKGIPSSAQFRFKKTLPEKYWGEFGFAFSKSTLWVSWDNSCFPVSFGNIRQQFKRIISEMRGWRKRNY